MPRAGQQFLRDLRHTASGLRRRPAFTLAAVMSLGVGIGAVATVFSVVNALLIRPLPYTEPDRLVAIWPSHFVAEREVQALRDRARSYDIIASHSPGWLMALTGVQTPRQIDGARVSGSFFTLLGVRPVLGRVFGAEGEVPGQDRVVVLSDELWHLCFGSDPAIVGRSVLLDHEAYIVVAVMPPGFRALNYRSDLWTPMTRDPSSEWWSGATEMLYGRLRSGTNPAAASLELGGILPEIQREFHLAADWAEGARVIGLKEQMVGALRPTLVVLFAAVGFLLALAAANVATLLLVRAAERRHEMAVRVALGASAQQIAAYLLTESLVIGAIGGTIGVALAYAGVGLLRHIPPASLPRLSEIVIDGRVLAVAIVLTMTVTLLFGLAPAIQIQSAGRGERLRSGRNISGGAERTRALVVSLEVALAVILAVGATLMGRTLVALHHVDPGFNPDRLLTMHMQPSSEGSDDQLRAYWRDVLSRVRAINGVTSASTVLHLPTGGRSWNAEIRIDGRPGASGETPATAHWQVVSPGYFRTAGVPLIRGRDFGEDDGPAAPRVIAVSTAFVARVFPGQDPIGRRISAGHATDDSVATIIAVVGSVRHDSLNVVAEPEVYVPLSQKIVYANSLVIRTAGSPLALVAAIRGQILAADRDVPISDVRTMDDLLSASIGRQRMMLILLGVFAGVGLMLSTIGIYGVVAHGVSQRSREMSIRMALGADAGAIRRLVIGGSLGYVVLGVAAGVPVALALAQLMRGLVYGVSTADPGSFVGVPVLLIVVAIVASWMPARRAVALGPAAVLREE